MASLDSCAIVSLGIFGKFAASQNGFKSEANSKTEISAVKTWTGVGLKQPCRCLLLIIIIIIIIIIKIIIIIIITTIVTGDKNETHYLFQRLSCYTVAIQLLYSCYTVAIQLLFQRLSCYTVAIQLLYSCYTVAIQLLYSLSCYTER